MNAKMKKVMLAVMAGAMAISSTAFALGSYYYYGPEKGAVNRTCTATGGAGGASKRVTGFYSFLGTDLSALTEEQRTLKITVNSSGGSGYGTGGAGGGYSSISFNGVNIITVGGGGGGGGGIATETNSIYAGNRYSEPHPYSYCDATSGSAGQSVSENNTSATSGSHSGGAGSSSAGGGGGGGDYGGAGGTGQAGGNAGHISGTKAKDSCTATDIANEVTCYTVGESSGTPSVNIYLIRESTSTF